MEARSEPVQRTAISARGEWQWRWFAVFLLNLPVPLFLGIAATSDGGLLGMLTGIVAVWLIGHVAVVRFRSPRGAIVFGAALLAVSQVVPFLQVVVGAVAMAAVDFDDRGAFADARAFAVTLLTAAQLAFAAFLLGYVFHLDAGMEPDSHERE